MNYMMWFQEHKVDVLATPHPLFPLPILIFSFLQMQNAWLEINFHLFNKCIYHHPHPLIFYNKFWKELLHLLINVSVYFPSWRKFFPAMWGRGHLNTYPITQPIKNKIFLDGQGFLNSLLTILMVLYLPLTFHVICICWA